MGKKVRTGLGMIYDLEYTTAPENMAYSGNRSLAFSNDVGKELDEGIQSTAAKLTSCRLEAQIDNNPKPPVKENQMSLR